MAAGDTVVMAPLLEQHRAAIEALCRKHHVKRLEVFGSAARDDFDPERSDVDLLVEFAQPGLEAAWTYFYLWEDLEDLLGRKVDLVEPGGLQNRFFAASLARDRRTFFAAA